MPLLSRILLPVELLFVGRLLRQLRLVRPWIHFKWSGGLCPGRASSSWCLPIDGHAKKLAKRIAWWANKRPRGADVKYTGRTERTVAGVAMLFMSKSSSDCIKIRITSCYNKSLSLFANLFPYFRGIANSPHFADRPKPRPVTPDWPVDRVKDVRRDEESFSVSYMK